MLRFLSINVTANHVIYFCVLLNIRFSVQKLIKATPSFQTRTNSKNSSVAFSLHSSYKNEWRCVGQHRLSTNIYTQNLILTHSYQSSLVHDCTVNTCECIFFHTKNILIHFALVVNQVALGISVFNFFCEWSVDSPH